MLSLDPKKFGTIEEISAKFAAYSNWPATTIRSFSKKDVIAAATQGKTEGRSFQDPSVELELNQFFQKLNASGISNSEKDRILSEWARNFHIARVAHLYNEFPDDPIRITPDLSNVTDGAHRIMAAIALGNDTIECIVEGTTN